MKQQPKLEGRSVRMNKANLKRLADYLRDFKPTADRDFSMEVLAEGSPSSWLNTTTCGSIGCAIGHGPYAGMPKNKGESWSDYQYRVFGLVKDDNDFCFSVHWGNWFPTAQDAAARIYYLIEHGRAPECWSYNNPFPKVAGV